VPAPTRLTAVAAGTSRIAARLMKDRPVWQWDELQQVGVDYSDAAEVERYEARMGEFRDLAAEDAAILAELSLPANSQILEIGTGTGHFAIAAARAGHRVTALDVSPAMLKYAQARAKAQGLTGVEFCHAGFLTFSAAPASFDAAVSVAVLHHLPDLWKSIALENIRRALRPGGLFLLCDIVFAWQGQDYAKCFEAWINSVPESTRKGTIGHAAQEYSTLTWIMEGLLKRAGFEILRIGDEHAPIIAYLCRNSAE
jgi:putative AdoMet-dependent methyltransferase